MKKISLCHYIQCFNDNAVDWNYATVLSVPYTKHWRQLQTVEEFPHLSYLTTPISMVWRNKCQPGDKWSKVMSSSLLSLHTCSLLKGRDSFLKADHCLSVTAGTNLWVKGSHVEEDASLLQRQVLLTDWHPCEGVIPAGKRVETVTSYFWKARVNITGNYIVRFFFNNWKESNLSVALFIKFF